LRLRGDVDVSFTTDDGAVSGLLPGTLSDDGVPGEESGVSLNSSAFLPTDEFLDVVTLTGISVDGFDEVSFNLFLGGGESATGGLSITGTQACEGAPDAPDAVAECFSPLFEAGLGELEPIDGSASK
jgi:hypothetical protein